MGTFGEKDLLDGEFVVVERVVAGGDDFETLLDTVAVEVHEETGESNMVGRDSAVEPSVVVVSEGCEAGGSVEPVESIDTAENRHI